jgi:hypothetical protein
LVSYGYTRNIPGVSEIGTIILSGNKTREAQPISLVTFWEKKIPLKHYCVYLIKRMNPQKISVSKSENMLIHLIFTQFITKPHKNNFKFLVAPNKK